MAFPLVVAGAGRGSLPTSPEPRSRPCQRGLLDAPPAATREDDISPGGAFYGVSKLYSLEGRRIGRDQVACTFVDNRGFAACGAKGSIDLRAGRRFPECPAKLTVAVIGGTGVFEGVRGSTLSADRGKRTERLHDAADLLTAAMR
ncbi:MAG: hypothetical protein QOK40_12 [Miltoncostaeaceae bacterium]|nr:hypothetical protein [Miltoncostaeaceae bacterium]